MKKFCFLVLLLTCLEINAQGVFSNKTNTVLQQVIQDYPNRFSNIKGDKINGNQRTTDYHSKINVPGASGSIVSVSSNAKSGVYAWRTDLYQSDDFNQSKDRFKEVFDNIKNTIVKIDGMAPVIINGKYEYPTEDRQNTVIGFQLLPAPGDLQKLRVELSLQKAGAAWKVVLTVFDSEQSDVAIAN